MEIGKDKVVTLHYKLSDAQGNQIEESQAPMVYLHGGYHNTLPKIEEALNGISAGYQVTIQVEPVDAFGEYHCIKEDTSTLSYTRCITSTSTSF